MYWTRIGNLDHALVDDSSAEAEESQFVAGIAVRMGTNDFGLAQSGVLNLLSELLFDGLGDEVSFEGNVGQVVTRYLMAGEQEKVETALRTLTERVINPPVDRLDYARRKTQLRFERWAPDIGSVIASTRFGFNGPGIQGVYPFAIEDIDPQAIWSIGQHFFNASNVVVFSNRAFSSSFEIKLPEGQRIESQPIAQLVAGPSIVPISDARGIALDILVASDMASRIGYGLIYRTLHNRICEMELLATELAVFDHRSAPLVTQRATAAWCDPDNHTKVATAIAESFDDLINGYGPLDFEEIKQSFIVREQQDLFSQLDKRLNNYQDDNNPELSFQEVQRAVANIWDTRIIAEHNVSQLDQAIWGKTPNYDPDTAVDGKKFQYAHTTSSKNPQKTLIVSKEGLTLKVKKEVTTTRMDNCELIVRNGPEMYRFFDRRGLVTTIKTSDFRTRWGRDSLIDNLDALIPRGRVVTLTEKPEETAQRMRNKKLQRRVTYLACIVPIGITTIILSLLHSFVGLH